MSDPLSQFLGGSGSTTTSPAPTATDPLSALLGTATATNTPAAGASDPLSTMFANTPGNTTANGDTLSQLLAGSAPGSISASGATPAANYQPKSGVLGGIQNALHTAGHVASGVMSGAGKVVSGIGSMAGEIQKESTMLPVNMGESIVNDVAGHTVFQTPTTQFDAANPGAKGTGLGPSQAEWTNELNKMPVAGGILRGLQQTGEEVAHPSRIVKNYSANPIQSGLNDLASLASILPGVGEAIHGLAIGNTATDAALMAAKAGDVANGSVAAARAAKVGDIITQIGQAQSLPLKGARAGLLSLADRITADPELLHVVDDAVNLPGGTKAPVLQTMVDQGQKALDAGAVTGSHAAILQGQIDEARTLLQEQAAKSEGVVGQLNADRETQIAKLQNTGDTASRLGSIGARMQDNTKMALNMAVDGMNRIKQVAADSSLSVEESAKLKQQVTTDTANRLIKSGVVERINEFDRASLEAAAKDAHVSFTKYVHDLGFTSLDAATSARFGYPNAFVPNPVAEQLARYTKAPETSGLATGTLRSVNKLSMIGKLAISPTTLVNRLGHGMLAVAANPNVAESFRLAAKDLLGKVHIGPGLAASDLEKLATQTTEVSHGAVWEASAKAESENPTRMKAITKSLMNMPSDILSKSPILKAARSVDDSVRSGIWLAARHSGATADEADLILGNAAGYFDRSTQAQRGISAAIPFFNWHKQVLTVLERMAETHPTAFARFTQAASNMAQYNAQQGIYGSNTRWGGVDTNLSFLSPFSATSAALSPQELLTPALKAAFPIVTGVGVNGKPTSTPAGALSGGGAQQIPAAIQELIKTTPQLQAGINGSQPRYGNGQPRLNAQGGGALQTWSTLLGVPTEKSSTAQATNTSIAAAAAKANKVKASKQASYQKKLAASGQ